MWRIRLSESGSFLCRRDSVLLCTRFLGAAPKAPEIFWMDTPAERPSSPLLMSAIPSILTSEAESLSAAPVNNRLFVATISVTTTSSSIPELASFSGEEISSFYRLYLIIFPLISTGCIIFPSLIPLMYISL